MVTDILHPQTSLSPAPNLKDPEVSSAKLLGFAVPLQQLLPPLAVQTATTQWANPLHVQPCCRRKLLQSSNRPIYRNQAVRSGELASICELAVYPEKLPGPAYVQSAHGVSAHS